MLTRSLATLAVLTAAMLTPVTNAQAQEACVTEANNDFLNFQYDPTRPFSGRNGFLSVLADDIIADDEHTRSSATRTVVPPTTNPTEGMSAVATYNILSGHAEIWGLGGGEVGIEILMEARDPATGNLLCSDLDQIFIARFNEHGSAPLGVTSQTCLVPSSHTGSVTIELEAHAWATFGGFASAGSALTLQITDFGVESCTGSCGSTCGMVSSSGGACFCDSVCSTFGDCCADVTDSCQTDSCWESCDGPSSGGTCWCDSACTTYGDCCDDKAATCD